MRRARFFALSCIFVAGCGSVPNTGLDGSSIATVVSRGDRGVYRGFDIQAVRDSSLKASEAIFRSVHPGASESGYGYTEWTYVRTVDLDHAGVLSGRYNLSPEIRRFFRECAPVLDLQDPSDALRSGSLPQLGVDRLVLTRLRWRTELGPGPNRFETARVTGAELEVLGATAAAMSKVTFDVKISSRVASSEGGSFTVLARKLADQTFADVHADCGTQTLAASARALGGTGWFPRGGVNNIKVEIEER
ncbi:hypothetical protein EOC93_28200 [Mesorhizobium sp. M6A.T.Ce.TU.002.03.1.1]|uniref:hypothetical protein n=1 Tax=Mesorhizobium sp. M6A.T.Ce.TU.002.03.1.1 TaxID=2496782 RepID=UPI000FCCA7BF|nr:hypothetical protein [Mesorhizobium sp. M6A.T.Ce.TU.002.03.1.1]RUU33678.1 hypothetical protein EOC93_28200 [Mesorhizobium sp. M6A.T.Ce.TU.002.03.1.1]